MNLLTRMFRKPKDETQQKKAAVDHAFAKFMQEIRAVSNYWRDVFEPEYKSQPIKIEHKAD